MSDPNTVQPLEPEYADDIFSELVGLEVHLDPDPLPFGLKRINGKIALCRKHLARTERIFLDVAQRLSRYKRQLRAAALILDLEKKNLIANDPEVRAGRAVSERDALATGKLVDEVQAVANATHAVEDLDMVFSVVKAKRSDLRDTQSRLRDQIRVCQDEISLGARWGSKSLTRGTTLEPNQGFADGADVAEVDELIQTVRAVADAEFHQTAEVDDSDPEEEQDADLTVGAEEPEPEAVDPEPEPKPEVVGPEPEPEPKHFNSDQLAEPPPGTEFIYQAVEPDPVFSGKAERNPQNAPISATAAEIVPGNELVDDFGFVPHCAECGETQHLVVGSGMCCPNGHRGCDSVAPSGGLGEKGEEPAAADVLPGTSDSADVANFLSSGDEDVKPLSRREIDESDSSLDIESILLNFKS